MARALDPNRTFDYILEEDRSQPKEKQTVFHLKVLSARQLASLEDEMAVVKLGQKGEMQMNTGSHVLKVLEIGLVGWENLLGSNNGEHIPYNKDQVNRFDYLRPDWRREIANAITEQNALSEEQVKN